MLRLSAEQLWRATSNFSYNHYSIGRTIESALGLPNLTANDQYAYPINDAFVAPITPPATISTLSTPTSSVPQGGSIVFRYSTPTSTVAPQNWVGIYSAGKTPGNGGSTLWQYTPNTSGIVTFSTSSLGPGSYSVYYLNNNGYTVLSGPITFTVTTP